MPCHACACAYHTLPAASMRASITLLHAAPSLLPRTFLPRRTYTTMPLPACTLHATHATLLRCTHAPFSRTHICMRATRFCTLRTLLSYTTLCHKHHYGLKTNHVLHVCSVYRTGLKALAAIVQWHLAPAVVNKIYAPTVAGVGHTYNRYQEDERT